MNLDSLPPPSSRGRPYAYAGRRQPVTDSDPQRPGHDRWLISYADFMTLLMAFFVVMYSISQVSEQKYRVLSQTFSEAFKSPEELQTLVQEGEPQLSHTLTPVDLDGTALEDRPGNDATNDVPESFVRIEEQLEQSFEELIDNQLVTVNGDERWLQIELPSAVLFQSGGIKLSEPASEIVSELASILEGFDNVVRVEGFTDNIPVNGGDFESNWELSSARASAVVKMLVEAGIGPERLAAVGYGEHQPVATNQTEEGRSRNRRIVLMVSTRDQLREDVFAEPAAIAGNNYLDRPELPEGTLVRGLDSDALEEARAWLATRYPQIATTPQVEPANEIAEPAAPAATAPSLGDGIESVILDNGALLFTNGQP